MEDQLQTHHARYDYGAVADLWRSLLPRDLWVHGCIWIGVGVSVICYSSWRWLKPNSAMTIRWMLLACTALRIWGPGTGSGDQAVNPAGNNGFFYGNRTFLIQLKAVVVTIVYSFIVSFVLLKIVDAFMGLRVSEDEERIGLISSNTMSRATPCWIKGGNHALHHAIIQPDRWTTCFRFLKRKRSIL